MIFRSFLASFLALVWTGLCSFLCLWTVYIDTSKQNSFLRMWSGVLVKIFGLNIHVVGEENIPDGGCIFLFNHKSLLDIPVLSFCIKKTFRFGAKGELFKIPVFGFSMRRIGMLPIYRSNKKKVLDLYSNSVDKIQSGMSYMLAPESTRSESDELMEFKSGPFILAIEAQVPLVGVVIHNTRKILPRKKIFANLKDPNIKIEILPAYSTESLIKEDRKRVKDDVRRMFLNKLSSA